MTRPWGIAFRRGVDVALLVWLATLGAPSWALAVYGAVLAVLLGVTERLAYWQRELIAALRSEADR